MDKITEKPTNNFLEKINEQAEITYQEVSGDSGIDSTKIYFSRRCEQTSTTLKKHLDKIGINCQIATYGGWDITNHEFIIAKSKDQKIIIDPTWQQFLDQPNPLLPKVLISPIDELEDNLIKAGIKQNKHHIWKTAKTR